MKGTDTAPCSLLLRSQKEHNMAQKFARPFYNSATWQSVRQSVLERSGGLCERCWKKGIIRTADVVHHKIFLTPKNIRDPNVSLNPKHLEALCQDCHAEAHSSKTRRRYRVDGSGEVVIREEEYPPRSDAER